MFTIVFNPYMPVAAAMEGRGGFCPGGGGGGEIVQGNIVLIPMEGRLSESESALG